MENRRTIEVVERSLYGTSNNRCTSDTVALMNRAHLNYAINPTPEQALRSNRAVLPAWVIAALDLRWLLGSLRMG
jgi:hypothetical protein